MIREDEERSVQKHVRLCLSGSDEVSALRSYFIMSLLKLMLLLADAAEDNKFATEEAGDDVI